MTAENKKRNVMAGVVVILLGVFLGLGAFTFHYGEGLSYFSKDPKACVNCHIMQPQFDSWQKASHHAVASCVECHLPHSFVPKWIAKGENGFLHSKGFTMQNFHEPIFIRENNMKILQENCLHCHKDFIHDILPVSSQPESIRCVHCHRSVGHGETVGLGKYEPVKNMTSYKERSKYEAQ
ncbi:MAG: cytochrome c nitrite reductase small subunit [Candidatus Omnitrophica bacterium]|nr:cytochrome c nitrite reductase small subunit [Candidatus Omnitrophota bacterium]MCB9748046.1 cytochrome c nitrite reductase small subunit [Candidatus Omnitrophota bacterium]